MPQTQDPKVRYMAPQPGLEPGTNGLTVDLDHQLTQIYTNTIKNINQIMV